MKHWSLAGSTAAIALFAGAAQADVTPAEVWQNWQDMSASYGQTVTGTEAESGGTLVVSNLTMTTEEDGTKVVSTIPEVRFADKGDGTVEITMSDSYVVTLEDSEDNSSAEITLSQPGMVVTASGTSEATDYAFAAPSIEIRLTKVDGQDAVSAGADVAATLTNLGGHYLVTGSDTAKTLDSEFSADSLNLKAVVKDPETQTDLNMTASVASLSGKGVGNFVGLDMDELADALKAGTSMDFSVSYGAVAYDMNVTEATGPTMIRGGSQGGSMQLAMDAVRLLLATSGKGVEVAVSGPEIPLPQVSLSYAESAMNFLIPLGKSDTPQDFTAVFKLIDLSVPEDIWAMVDPGAQIPHDPATLIIDTKGQMTVTTEITDEAAMDALGDASPAALNALEITEIRAKVAGAEISGNGALTFDNTDLTTFEGFPAPTGKIELKLLGINSLMDKLMAMGLMPEDALMGARMGLAMLAKPVTGPDDLTSTLEFKDKHFYANGQQLQ